MATAFQSNAFQTVPLAWQIVTTPAPTPGRSGLGGDDVPRHTRVSPSARGWNRAEYERQREEEGRVEQTLREVYSELTGEDAPVSTLSRVDAIVRPASRQVRADAPLRIDWARLARDYERTNALIRLQREEAELRTQIEDEDDLLMLMQ